jgi:hypothetical protein
MSFIVSEQMVQLAKDLQQKRGITESSTDAYIRTLVLLNDKKPFKNITFLKDVDAIEGKLKDYALSTRKNIIATICSVLGLYQQPSYKKYYKIYSEKLKEMMKELDEKRGDTLVKTDKEKENWVDWKDVITKRDVLAKEVAELGTAKNITLAQYEKLLTYLVLCLYTYLPPRRNMDYQEMWVVRQWNDKMPADRNYLDLHSQQFIFNRYKTAKASGQQRIDIPDTDEAPLKDAIVAYLRHNAHYKASKNKATEFRFLTKADGTPLSAVNSITRILNKAFGKKVGSSMLRHSYLSQKYGAVMEEMKEDAAMMAHDGSTQKTYIRAKDSDSDEDDTIEHV